jgi:hypothetical protein
VDTLELVATDRTSCRATVGQEYFFYLEQQARDPRAFAHSTILRLDGPLDRAALARSVEAVLARHSVYRTTLVERDGRVVQALRPPVENPITIVDRSPLPEAEWAATCTEQVQALIHNEHLARGVVLALAPDRHALILVVHHGVSDGGATEALLREVFEVYPRLCAGNAAFPENERPLQFIDFAAALEAWGTTPAGLAQREAWNAILAGAAPLQLPVDHPRAELDTLRDSVPCGIVAEIMHPIERVELTAATVAAVARLARAERTSPYAVYLAALAGTIRELDGQDDVSIEVAYSPRFNLRLHRQLAPVHGLLTTWTIARLDLAATSTLADQIPRARRMATAIQELGGIQDYYQVVPVGLRRAVYNYVPIRTRPQAEVAPGLRATRLSPGWSLWKRPWELHLTVVDGPSTQVFFTCNARLFTVETTRRFLAAFLARLPAI